VKVYVSADIEGVACISAPSEADINSPDYGPFRTQMTAEVNAACGGAFEAGAETVVVKDAHATGRNIDPNQLRAPDGRSLQLIRGWSGHPFSMVQELDTSFQLAAFVGFHSAAGGDGNPLAHTVSGRLFSRLQLNGRLASEFYLFALAAASVDVPVAFLSGDESLCEEAQALIPGIRTVATTRGRGPSVQSMLPHESIERIRQGVYEAVASKVTEPLRLPDEFHFVVEFVRPSDAYARSFYPGVTQLSARELEMRSHDYFDVLTFLKIASKMS
jgi:D-amino peptidase